LDDIKRAESGLTTERGGHFLQSMHEHVREFGLGAALLHGVWQ